MKILEQIRSSVDGIIGSYVMNTEGKIIANDLPFLFENELISVSYDLFQLQDIVKSARPIDTIKIKAEQGFILLVIGDGYIVGTFASKQVDESLLDFIVHKAITSITPEDIAAVGALSVASEETLQQLEVAEDVSTVILKTVSDKIRILYGDKMAQTKVREAFKLAGVDGSTTNLNELKAVLDILGEGILARMMGDKKATKFLTDLLKQHGLN